MKFTKQDRRSFVTLSEAKGLARWAARCFAALSMTGPVVVGKLHNRVSTHMAHLTNTEAINRVPTYHLCFSP